MMKRPELVTATQAELDELLTLAKTTFPTRQYELLEGVLGTFVYVMQALQNAKTSIKRFRQMLFGARTESKRNVLDHGASTSGDPPLADGTTSPPDDHKVKLPSHPPQVGHGRNGAQKYCDSPVVEVTLADLKSGDPCPECTTGKVYDSPPKTIVKVVGQPPLAATIFKLQQLRCRLCDTTYTAPMPDGAASPKYDHSCASMLALLRYGSGMPFYRLEGLQASLNVPLPDATQWEIVAKAVPGPKAAFGERVLPASLHEID